MNIHRLMHGEYVVFFWKKFQSGRRNPSDLYLSFHSTCRNHCKRIKNKKKHVRIFMLLFYDLESILIWQFIYHKNSDCLDDSVSLRLWNAESTSTLRKYATSGILYTHNFNVQRFEDLTNHTIIIDHTRKKNEKKTTMIHLSHKTPQTFPLSRLKVNFLVTTLNELAEIKTNQIDFFFD